jgi:hypothetical protein
MEGETIRDALPDPKGRYLFLLGRRVHVFDANGQREIRTLDFEDPMAIAVTSSGTTLAVIGAEDFGNTRATVIALYDLATLNETAREPLQTDKTIEAALFAASDRAVVALSREQLYEKPMVTRKNTVAQISESGTQMRVNIGDIVNSDRICLPENAGPQIATLGRESELLIYAERRCSASGAVAGSARRVTPASLYGVSAYAIAYDRDTNSVVATDRAGFLTIYKVPRPTLAR